MFTNNTVTLDGFVAKDPDVQITKSGKTLCVFTLSVRSPFKVDERPRFSYFRIETWNKLAEFCAKTVKKGKHVQVNGKLHQDRWKDVDGRLRSHVKLVGRTVQFLEIPRNEEKVEAAMQ